MSALYDPAAAWAALPAELQAKVGAAAMALAAGVAAEEDAPPGLTPGVHACSAATMVLGELVRETLPPDGAIGVIDLGPIGVRTCRGCGCTDWSACEGGCDWVDANLCSRCQRAGRGRRAA